MTINSLIDGTRDFMTAAGQLPSPGFDSPEVRELRLALISEEVDEYLKAESDDDLTEICDGLADILVTTIGGLLAYEGDRYSFGDYTIDTPAHPRASFGDDRLRAYQRGAIEHFAGAYYAAETTPNQWLVMVTLHRLARTAWQTLCLYVGPETANDIVAEIARSNNAKIVDGNVIRNPDTGKILKPEGWQRPDVAGILARHIKTDLKADAR